MRLSWALAPVLLCQLIHAQGVVAIYPSPLTISPGVTQKFTIYNTTGGTGVTWSVNGTAGGSATFGTISTAGLYTAPTSVPASNVVAVTATSVPSGISGGSSVKIVQPIPTIWSTAPSNFTTGVGLTMSLNGANFVPSSLVQVGGAAWVTTYVNSTTLKAKGDLPTTGTFAVKVTNPGNGASVSGPVNITVGAAPPPPISVTVAPASVTVALSATAKFSATVTGTSNTAVTWSATAGSIDPTGLYTAPATLPASQAVTITAVSVANPAKSGQAAVLLQSYVTSGGGNGGDLHAGRFLEQAAFGPSPTDLAFIHQNTTVQNGTITQDGIDVWLASQFAMSATPIALPTQVSTVQSDTLHRLSTAPDQLRQKMAWVLSSFIVISMNKNIYPDQYVPYQQILSNDAFGNYRQLLYDITVSPQMGQYLDLANSNKAGVGSGANENYARELMQLFTIGLNMLNPDGSAQLVNGKPIPTYLQPDVVHVASALTGWTYPTAPGAQPQSNNQPYFSPAVMETRQANHDITAKTFLSSCSLAAGQTVIQDTNGVLDCLFNHPNVGPFVATRLIRGLVTSNPTPGYIQRVAAVFNDNGKGVRGDLQAVLTAILKDPEARQDTVTFDAGGNPFYLLSGAPVSYTPGRLKDPIYFVEAFVRALNGMIPSGTVIPWNFVAMGETVTQPPSVFGYWSPLYHLPLNSALFGPEFQIYTPTESVEEANMLQQIITMPNSDPGIDLSPFNAVVNSTAALLDLADQKFFYGRMPAQLRTALGTAIDANSDNPSRVLTAVYLAALAGQYQTQF